MREVLPIDERTRTEAHVVVGFWGRIATLESTPDAGAPTLATWQDSIRSSLEEAVADGALRAETPQDAVMALLRSITYGQQVVEVTEPQCGLGTPGRARGHPGPLARLSRTAAARVL